MEAIMISSEKRGIQAGDHNLQEREMQDIQSHRRSGFSNILPCDGYLIERLF